MDDKENSIKRLNEIKNKKNIDDKLKEKIDEKLKYINKPLNK